MSWTKCASTRSRASSAIAHPKPALSDWPQASKQPDARAKSRRRARCTTSPEGSKTLSIPSFSNPRPTLVHTPGATTPRRGTPHAKRSPSTPCSQRVLPVWISPVSMKSTFPLLIRMPPLAPRPFRIAGPKRATKSACRTRPARDRTHRTSCNRTWQRRMRCPCPGTARDRARAPAIACPAPG